MKAHRLIEIQFNEPEFLSLELFGVALSEPSEKARLRAIEVMRQEVTSLGLGSFPMGPGHKRSPNFVLWVAETSQARYEAAHEYSQILQRCEAKNERKLNIAEHVGKLVWDSKKKVPRSAGSWWYS
ncbi:hypothetical protein shim_27530 [Shimia sp. SK013]|uniref:hypothetical protein n=1 Tax=Shimia sp. SK013 TaxID=1389006 RepID=UPI0006B49BE7|nr:hypothetical protein [Shimia sp. SK013]KPA20839.1 hypothetical protein shim_27530 [Shimia sp. SK013]